MLVLLVAALTATGRSAGATQLPGFRSPTGNIRCLFIPGGHGHAMMLCTIAQAAYARRLTTHCEAPPIGLDWAGFELQATTKGRTVCSGGILYSPATQHPHYVTLPYGRTWRHKMFDCTSRVIGVNCSNHSGHGLFLSRETWRTW